MSAPGEAATDSVDPRRRLEEFQRQRGIAVRAEDLRGVDLYALYTLVCEEGGIEAVVTRHRWQAIKSRLSTPLSAAGLRRMYSKYLYLYELHDHWKGQQSANEAYVLAGDESLSGARAVGEGGVRRSGPAMASVSAGQSGGAGDV